MKRLVVCVLVLAVIAAVVVALTRGEERLPNGRTYIKGSGESYTVHYVLERNGQLVYAFIVDRSLNVVGTNDPKSVPASSGVHWLWHSRDGLWVNGHKVTFPGASKVFAIRRDCSIHPVAWPKDRLKAIGPGGGISDDRFMTEIILPSLVLRKF